MGETVTRGETSGETLKTPGFVHLRVHSAYSLLEGLYPSRKSCPRPLQTASRP